MVSALFTDNLKKKEQGKIKNILQNCALHFGSD